MGVTKRVQRTHRHPKAVGEIDVGCYYSGIKVASGCGLAVVFCIQKVEEAELTA